MEPPTKQEAKDLADLSVQVRAPSLGSVALTPFRFGMSLRKIRRMEKRGLVFIGAIFHGTNGRPVAAHIEPTREAWAWLRGRAA